MARAHSSRADRIQEDVFLGDGTAAGLVALIHFNSTIVGNVGAGADDLMTYTLPAGTLHRDGMTLRITAWGEGANNAAGKELKLLFGGTAIATIALTANSVRNWMTIAYVTRNTAGTQRSIASNVEGTAAAVMDVEAATPSETESGAIVIKCTGEATTTNDIRQFGLLIEVLNPS